MTADELLPQIKNDEFVAFFKFLALLVVLPLLPNKELDVIFSVNPRHIWFVVVFVAGLSFLAYLLSKVSNSSTAIGAAGMLGGCISPGLTIMSFIDQSGRYPEFSHVYASAAAFAVTMLFPRNLIVVGLVNPSLALSLVIPFAAMAGVSITVAVLFWSRTRTRGAPASELDTPFQIRSALLFGGIVAIVLAITNILELSVPSTFTQVGIVLATIAELVGYVGVTWTTGKTKMSQTLALILVGSAGFGISFVFLT